MNRFRLPFIVSFLAVLGGTSALQAIPRAHALSEDPSSPEFKFQGPSQFAKSSPSFRAIPTDDTGDFDLESDPTGAMQGHVTVLQYNVGNAIFPKFSVDDLRLSAREDETRIHNLIAFMKPDIVHFQEMRSGLQQVKRVIPKGYSAACPANEGSAQGMICIAWNRERVTPVGDHPCKGRFFMINPRDFAFWQDVDDASTYLMPNDFTRGGVVKCQLRVDGKNIQSISTYVPYLGLKAGPIRFQLQPSIAQWTIENWIWGSDFTDTRVPTIITGDFNTATCTNISGDLGCKRPTPPEFGTLFGFHKADYGRYKPKHRFYGHYAQYGGPDRSNSQYLPLPFTRRRVFGSRFDHAFANFGRPGQIEGCGLGGCLQGELGFPEMPEMTCRTCDHRALFTRVDW